MKRLLGLITAIALSTPAIADPDPFPEEELAIGTRFKQQPENAARDEAREMQKRVVRCSVYGNKELARKVLANSDPVTIDFDAVGIPANELTNELEISRCIGRAMKHSTYKMQMRFQYESLRALMAEEVYLMDNDDVVQLPADAEPFLTERLQGGPIHPRAEMMARLGDCIVFHGPEAADRLLRSRIASDEEREAVEGLYPALAKCGLGGAQEVELDFSMVRRVVADGLWSRTYFTNGSDAATGEDDA